MRKIKWAAAAIGVVFATPAFSQWYVGGSVGQTRFDTNDSDWQAPGFASTSFDRHDTGWKLFGGYAINNYFGVEAAYVDLGKYTATIVPPVAADTGVANVKVQSWDLFLTGKLPLAANFSLTGKLGLAYNRARMNFSSSGGTFLASDSGSDDRTAFAYGLGASYAVTKAVALRAEYEYLGKAGNTNNNFANPGNTSESKPSLLSFGAQYSF
jgi:OOP family OmpA-OmpF porin